MLDRRGLVPVIGLGRRTVGVDVVHVLCAQSRVIHGHPYGVLGTPSLRRRHGDVVRISRHTISDYLGDDRRTTGIRRLQCLQDDTTSSLSDDESVPALVEGAGGRSGIIVSGGERLHGRESGHGQRSDRGFPAPGDHHVGITALDEPKRIPDCVGA